MGLLSLLLLAFAVSLDSFGVGITYGMRKIRLPLRSILIIAICSAMMILIATGVAQGMLFFLTPHIAEVFGGLILVGLGLWALYNSWRTKNAPQPPIDVEKSKDHPDQEGYVWKLELKKLGIVIQILRTPMAADMDRSGMISGTEALILGFALSLDAFGAGIGASLMGYAPWLTALLIGTMSSVFVYLGMKFGHFFADTRWLSRISFLPGVILIAFGMWKIF